MVSISEDPMGFLINNSIKAVRDAVSLFESDLRSTAQGLDSLRRRPNSSNGSSASSAPSLRYGYLEGIMDFVRWTEGDANVLVPLMGQCSEIHGKWFFEDYQQDGNGELTLKDLKIEMKMTEKKLPTSIRHTNAHCEADNSLVDSPSDKDGAMSVLKSALAGGLACAFSTAVMHPVDTLKTCVQASTVSLPELVSKLPQIGVHGLYRGSIPAIVGQFYSHGLRTGLFEASRLVLAYAVPMLPEIQVYSLASFSSTMLGTASRIPCEVLKQRLQAGMFDNVGEAIVHTLEQDGIKGFIRGTKATIIREVPFYVVGTRLYDEAKKVARNILSRELEPWEAMVVGALSGGLTAVTTTPLDVVKTRMMTTPEGFSPSMTMVAMDIFRQEGPVGLFKGAVPRFFWVAPLGAINFAGYELIRKAMDKIEQIAGNRS